MAAFFQSWRGSGLPKTLLRYALSQLELLDTEALDIDNLDFALGTKSVFAFRDVGVKLKELEKLLQLPPTINLQKAKVLLLRITIPMDIFTSPIIVEVDGVDIKLQVVEHKPHRKQRAATPKDAHLVPDPMDLAKSFLKEKSSSEELEELEDALAAERQNMGASVALSDSGDSSDDDLAYGTGEPLSLPTFLASFLQGVIDRVQVKIQGVTFQFDLEVPVDPNSMRPEPVSFQLTMQSVDVEGVTTQSANVDASKIVPREGKRHISLAKIRAYLVSEAEIWSSTARSPVASPSVPCSPAATRNPPSREPTALPSESEASQHLPPMRVSQQARGPPSEPPSMQASVQDLEASARFPSLQNSFGGNFPDLESSLNEPTFQASFREQFGDLPMDGSLDLDNQLRDSEEALEIPYEFDDPEEGEEAGDESPATPKASMYHDFQNPSPESTMFHSTVLPPDAAPRSTVFGEERPAWGSIPLEQGFRSAPTLDLPRHGSFIGSERSDDPDEQMSRSASSAAASEGSGVEDLTKSHLYTREEAESMYMSAFSHRSENSMAAISPELSQQQLPPTASSSASNIGLATLDLALSQQDLSATVPALAPAFVPEPTESHEEELISFSPVASNPTSPAASQQLVPQEQPRQPEEPKAAPKTPSPLQSQVLLEIRVLPEAQEQTQEIIETVTEEISSEPVDPTTPRASMPGAWGDELDDSPPPVFSFSGERLRSSRPNLKKVATSASASDSDTSSPAFSRVFTAPSVTEQGEPAPKHQDDVETPKGPTRFTKEILSLENISIYVPSQHKHVPVQASSAEAISQLSQSQGRSTTPRAPSTISDHGTASSMGNEQHTGAQSDNALEVILSPIVVNFDMSLGFMLVMVAGKLMEALKNDKPPVATPSNTQEPAKQAPEFKLVLEELSLNFLNRLGGAPDTPERYLDPSAFIFDQEVLLNMTLQGLSASVSTEKVKSEKSKGKSTMEAGTLTRINLEQFRFGYANGDIVSFDSTQTMSTSIKETTLKPGCDVSIEICQLGDEVTTDISTRPLLVQVDLQRLDETFSWFGGLSSFLNMSTSMTSSPAPTPKITPSSPQKPRGVHFSTPIDPEDKSAVSQNKINVRIGGSYVELAGKDCSIFSETSSIKLVSRDEGIGMTCSSLRASGPYLHGSSAAPAITTKAKGLRLEFLSNPRAEDLEDLVGLILPTGKMAFDKNVDDAILVDTLLAQRRKGSLLRLTVDTVNVDVRNMAQLSVLPNLGEEISKLATVAKYLPEDDRPGLLTLAKVEKVRVDLDAGGKIGHLGGALEDVKVAHITFPSLVAIALHGISVKRNHFEDIITSSAFIADHPILGARMVGDELEPRIKLNLVDLNIEYRVSTIMDLLDLGEDATPEDFDASLAASIANLGDHTQQALTNSSSEKSKASKPTTLDVSFFDCLIGLNPLGLPSKMVIAFVDVGLLVELPKEVETRAELSIRKAKILLIDDIAAATARESGKSHRRQASNSVSVSPRVEDLCQRGFVDICLISSASAVVDITSGEDGEKQINVELRDDLLVLQTCADSTQTLISLANALKPPTPPSKEEKYRTRAVPITDLLASISPEAFGQHEGEYDFDQDFAGAREMAGSGSDMGYDTDSPIQIHSQYYAQGKTDKEELLDAAASSILDHKTKSSGVRGGVLFDSSGSNHSPSQVSDSDDNLSIHENYYSIEDHENSHAKLWDWRKNEFTLASDEMVSRCPIKVSVRDVLVIWKLYDGYDWVHTRDVITKAVEDVQNKAYERRALASPSHMEDEEDEEAIGDFLFNSIYIGIPAKSDPQELARGINAGLGANDAATETESVATTTFTSATNRTKRSYQSRTKSRRLKLKRSKTHKIIFELRDVNADLFIYSNDKTVNSLDVRVGKLEIIDSVPTSTWKKFLTYDQDKGPREMGSSMVHLELLTVKPILDLSASEFVLKATLQPLRLHVDQDALDFITRFFEFKDENVPVHASPADIPFIQRAEVFSIPVKLDFKPKRVDYAGLRSGHTTEFMNFVTLEEARLVLQHAIIYGIRGFDRLGQTLNDIWMPDVKAHQLPGVLAGLAPLRSVVNVGSGFRSLIEVPIQEYKKDGRIMRSLGKGAAAFVRTTGTELVKFGAKLAVGTQYALQNAEDMLSDKQHEHVTSWNGEDDDDFDPEEKKRISLYAIQPSNFLAGVQGGFRSLQRDVTMARDAIVAIPAEAMESQSAVGAAKAVLRHTPTIIIRPTMGVSKAIGQTLMGATNTIDPHNRRRIEEKYKKH